MGLRKGARVQTEREKAGSNRRQDDGCGGQTVGRVLQGKREHMDKKEYSNI